MQSVDLAVDEMRYAREKLGMCGGFLRPNPYRGKKMINDPMYEPFWAVAEPSTSRLAFTRDRPTRCRPSASTASRRIAAPAAPSASTA
jgi:hypothetical protein